MVAFVRRQSSALRVICRLNERANLVIPTTTIWSKKRVLDCGPLTKITCCVGRSFRASFLLSGPSVRNESPVEPASNAVSATPATSNQRSSCPSGCQAKTHWSVVYIIGWDPNGQVLRGFCLDEPTMVSRTAFITCVVATRGTQRSLVGEVNTWKALF
jgi:hypothetical protein